MRKLRLDMDALAVETFETAAVRPGAGTVHGARVAIGYGSGESDCGNCHSDDPCTGIPIDTCTCGCGDVLAPVQGVAVAAAASGCAATSPCTCIPVETCSCSPGYY